MPPLPGFCFTFLTEARVHLERALAQRPTESQAQYFLAETSARLGDGSLAMARYRAAIPLDPTDVQILSGSGWALLGANQYKDALSAYETSRLAPGSSSIRSHLAENLKKQGMDGPAEVEYERTRELDPGVAQARDELERVSGSPDERHGEGGGGGGGGGGGAPNTDWIRRNMASFTIGAFRGEEGSLRRFAGSR